MDLQKNKDLVYEEVARAIHQANRPESSVAIVAVTKYVDSDTVAQLVDLGVQHIGENRVDKFLDKYEHLKDKNVTWHLIGTLQRRKVKEVINLVDYFHALDSVKLAKEIQKRAQYPIKCFLQVNISGEESKHGFKPDELDEVLEELSSYDKLKIVGLMTMAPIDATERELNYIFKQTNDLRQSLKERNIKNMPFDDLSMGMSRDFPIAIQNGSTFVRIGTSFFRE
ncbi:YggS family pyridoxal phosphate-dependent enzyme [Streptococcus dentapri]|uniref:Pyridoxal phosphate homeostasis protein n=1 Tax=Streptococcus dentapri TaxID=573564 RepID=A0ABV8CZU5_9STRE